MSPTLKASLLFLSAVALHVGIKPPNPPPTKADKVTKGTLFEKNPRFFGLLMRSIYNTRVAAEIVLLLWFAVNPFGRVERISQVCPSGTSATQLANLSKSFLVGCGMMFVGVLGRVWCYQALGTLFTYEITIRPNHKLVTWGPYAYVRHPSYTACFILWIGSVVVTYSSNGIVDACGISPTTSPLGWILQVFTGLIGYTIYSLAGRGWVEDEMLRKTFGREWEEYAKRVPQRLLPGIL